MEDWFKWLDRIILIPFHSCKWSWINTSSHHISATDYWVWAGTVAGVVFVWDLNNLFSIKKEEKNVVTTGKTPGWRQRKVGSPLRLRDPELNSIQGGRKERNFSFENQPCLSVSLCSTRSITGLVCYSIPIYLSVCLSKDQLF